MANFDEAYAYIAKNEGGLVDNPHDNGGITNHGISLRFLRAVEPARLKAYGIYDIEPNADTIRGLRPETAKAIYRGEFWERAPFEKILNQDVANYIFDMAVNMGIAPAIKCAQRATWAVMCKRVLADDGILGEKTISMLRQCGFLLLPAMRSERAGYYRLAVKQSPDDAVFLDGWLNRAYSRSA